MSRIPVTVLTGYLGSGKTTLVNRILSENHGKRIAVIENEFGEVGIDHELVIGADEEIFETSNGCICCTVRGDLIRILGQLHKRRDRFDSVLIETTGLADPGPVAQTFFIDEDLKQHYSLDAIVTLVDAHHIEQQLHSSVIAREQIAFADVLLLNKTDLVDSGTLARVERELRAINGTAGVLRSHNANVPLQRVLNLGAFDLNRALARDDAFLETPRPFEWAAVYELPAGRTQLHTGGASGHHNHDHDHDHDNSDGDDHTHRSHPPTGLQAVDLVLLPAPQSAAPIEDLLDRATALFATTPTAATPASALQPQQLYRLQLAHAASFALALPQAGQWILFCEHAADEFGLHVHGAAPVAVREFGSHHHDSDIGSIGMEETRPLDTERVNAWLSYLLQSRGQDILRMKGVLQLKGEHRRYVFHGVHMMFDGQLERPWGDTPRRSRLVFIGRSLARDELEAGLESCVA